MGRKHPNLIPDSHSIITKELASGKRLFKAKLLLYDTEYGCNYSFSSDLGTDKKNIEYRMAQQIF
jgi:hypothetical protein